MLESCLLTNTKSKTSATINCLGWNEGLRRVVQKKVEEVGGGQLGLRMLSICDRTLDSRDKNEKKSCLMENCPRMRPLGN